MGFGFFGVAAAIALSAVGSGAGAGVAAMSAIGSWKKCYTQGKKAPFMLVAYTGFPLSQTIYGLILMNSLLSSLAKAGPNNPAAQWTVLGLGIFGGIGMGVSAYFQGRAAAGACDALAETGKGTANYILVLGIIETVALFVMAFLLTVQVPMPAEAAAPVAEAVQTAAQAVSEAAGALAP